MMSQANGAWLSLVERCVRDAEVAGSNPVAPTCNSFLCSRLRHPRLMSLSDLFRVGLGYEHSIDLIFTSFLGVIEW